MRSLAQELRDAGRMFAKNPAMFFVALLVLGLAVSAGVQRCRRNDFTMTGSLRMSRVLRFSSASNVWRGDRVDRAILRTLTYPRPARKHKAAEKRTAARSNSAGAASAAPVPPPCAGLSDLRFPEFNLMVPLL